MTIHEAVRELRERLLLNRQIFATRLGISIGSLTFYENTRVPPADVLIGFASLAEEAGHYDLIETFADHLWARLCTFLQGRSVSLGRGEHFALIARPAPEHPPQRRRRRPAPPKPDHHEVSGPVM
jgi:transcriptional regulator with XRE-family HTH domain